jgi:hypothetical protein
MFLTLLPFFGSGFVPTESMPVGLRLFAGYQPFTPMIDALRGLLSGVPNAGTVIIAIVWCLAISIGGYIWPGSSTDGPEFGEVEAVRQALRSGWPPSRSRQDRRRGRAGEIL